MAHSGCVSVLGGAASAFAANASNANNRRVDMCVSVVSFGVSMHGNGAPTCGNRTDNHDPQTMLVRCCVSRCRQCMSDVCITIERMNCSYTVPVEMRAIDTVRVWVATRELMWSLWASFARVAPKCIARCALLANGWHYAVG